MVLFRLIKGYSTRKYTKVPWQSLVLIVGTIIYFLVPIDLISDFIAGVGYVDDAALIAWTINAVKKDIDDFRKCESNNNDGQQPMGV